VFIAFLVYPYLIIDALWNLPTTPIEMKDPSIIHIPTMTPTYDISLISFAPTPPRATKSPTIKPTSSPTGSQINNQIIEIGKIPPFNYTILSKKRVERNNIEVDLLEVESLCFDAFNRPFVWAGELEGEIIPEIQIRASAQSQAKYIKIKKEKSLLPQDEIEYISDRVMFYIGGVWPYHLSHFFINNYLPLINLLNNYYNTTNWMSIERDLSIDLNDGEYFDHHMGSLKFHTVRDRRVYTKNKLLCYKKALVGLNSTCSCCGCENRFYPKGSQVFKQMREYIFSTYLNITSTPTAFELSINIKIIQREQSRKIENINEIERYIKEELNLKVTIVNTESELKFEDQIKMMKETTILIASHGNALGNAFWLPDHSCVIEAQSFGQKGNLWFPITYSRGNESHPLYYYNVSCYDEKFDVKKATCHTVDEDDSPTQSFGIDIPTLGNFIKRYVDFHTNMSKLKKDSWDKIEIDTMKYLEL
jgi:hypothetical protein